MVKICRFCKEKYIKKNEWYWAAKIAVLKIKIIQVAEKQMQHISDNGRNWEKKQLKK